LNPEVTRLENFLYPALDNASETNRQDLVAILLTGVPTLNFTGPKPADLLRLNTAIAPAASPKRLGVLEGDFQGYPNGRRLTDDVIDITLQAAVGVLGGVKTSLGDGVDRNDVAFRTTFPYLAFPHSGGNAWKLNPNAPRGH
jgi:hypothetical protein